MAITSEYLITPEEKILVTGANGFIGSRVVDRLLKLGFRNIRCFVRPSSDLSKLDIVQRKYDNLCLEVYSGNLLSKIDCENSLKDISLVYHLAAGIEKTFPGCYMNSVVTTRNIMDVLINNKAFKRFVNVSSFSVYSNYNMKRGELLDESCELETKFMERNEAYCFGKTKQDEIVVEYGQQYKLPYVIVRPGAVYGPGNYSLTARVGIDTFGLFLHLGGLNKIPLTYVDNCAEAIVLAGITSGVDGEVFNVVDDELPTSRSLLKKYKKNAFNFKSIYVPYRIFYLFCYLWEKYSHWSKGQLPPAFNTRKCAAYWKGNRFSNKKIKDLLGWKPGVPFEEASKRYFEYAKQRRKS